MFLNENILKILVKDSLNIIAILKTRQLTIKVKVIDKLRTFIAFLSSLGSINARSYLPVATTERITVKFIKSDKSPKSAGV